jgi:hypothetical protein
MIYSILRVVIVFCGLFSALQATPIQEDLVAHYPMNEMSGDRIQDASKNKRDAVGEFINVVDGARGKVFSFDGKASKMFLPDDPAFEVKGNYSVAFWVRLEPGEQKGGRIYAQPSFAITNFRGTLRATLSHPEYGRTGYADLMGPAINDGKWHHVVVSYQADKGNLSLFVDGVLEKSNGSFIHKPEKSAPTTVGFFGRSFFNGELSDLRVYSRPLDVVDATGLYQSTAPK